MILSRTTILAAGMLISGSINTIASRFQDTSTTTEFNHPLVQTFFMFIGETLCLFVFGIQYLYKKNTSRRSDYPTKTGDEDEDEDGTSNKIIRFNPAIFALPALCDTSATTLLYLALLLTYTSVYQMLRGAVVVFTAIFSVLFLKRKLFAFHWVGVVIIVFGTLIVGLYSVLTPPTPATGSDSGTDQAAPDAILGDAVVVFAQIIVATQMVVEEKFISKYSVPPLLVVGFEGVWGLIFTTLLLTILHYKPITIAGTSFDDAIAAFHMIGSSGALLGWIIVGIFSIAFFNFFGISVTADLGASHRMILDTCRTLIVTSFALLTNIWMTVPWQPLQIPAQGYYLFLQFFGFMVLVLGAVVYFEVVNITPFLRRIGIARGPANNDGEEEASINSDHKHQHGPPLLGDHRKSDD